MAKFDLYQQLSVSLPDKIYPILIGHGALIDQELLRSLVNSSQVMIVTNSTIAPLYLKSVKLAFADRQCDQLILDDGEQYKNQESLTKVYDVLLENQHHRDTTLLALGGGVIGDLTGFAAATYQRGVRFIQLPTTLLAQVDASVGGKTAINHPMGKNMIGSFYQPEAVVIDLNTLSTLPLREFRAGIAEMIKYALLAGGDLTVQLEHALEQQLADNHARNLAELVRACCQVKADIVQNDEREFGSRALLNLGHTFAHALETYTQYKQWLHGEAVAIGLYCAALLSQELGLLDQSEVEKIERMLTLAKLPARIPATVDLTVLRDMMAQDKKIKNNKLRFILIKAIGRCYVEENVPESALRTVLQRAVKGE